MQFEINLLKNNSGLQIIMVQKAQGYHKKQKIFEFKTGLLFDSNYLKQVAVAFAFFMKNIFAIT